MWDTSRYALSAQPCTITTSAPTPLNLPVKLSKQHLIWQNDKIRFYILNTNLNTKIGYWTTMPCLLQPNRTTCHFLKHYTFIDTKKNSFKFVSHRSGLPSISSYQYHRQFIHYKVVNRLALHMYSGSTWS